MRLGKREVILHLLRDTKIHFRIYHLREPQYIVLVLSPNPFTSSLSIEYRLHEAGEAGLFVFDLSGRVIAVLEADLLTDGNHTVTWNPDSRVPDGCYLIVLDVCGKKKLEP